MNNYIKAYVKRGEVLSDIFEERVLSDSGTFEGDLCLQNLLNETPYQYIRDSRLFITPNGYKTSKLYTIKPTYGGGDFDFIRSTTATKINSGSVIETSPINTPRLDYTNSTCPSLLIEPPRTNLLTNSDGIITTYPTRGGNITTSTTPINGFTNSIDFLNNSTTSFLYKTFTPTIGVTYTLSVFIQMNDNSQPIVSNSAISGDFCLVSSGETTGTLTTRRIGTSNVYRVSSTYTTTSTNSFYGVVKYTTQSNKGFKVTGYQLEQSAFPTSYIPTTTTSVIRNPERAYLDISTSVQDNFTWYFEGTLNFANNGDFLTSLNISNSGNVSNDCLGWYNGLIPIYRIGGVQTVVSTTPTPNGSRYKVIIKRNGTTVSFFKNGSKISDATIPLINYNFMVFGSNNPSQVDMNKSYLLLSTLTDQQCIDLTKL